MSVDELKVELAKLTAQERWDFAQWIWGNDDIREMERDALIRELQHGIDQADRGELIDGEEVFKRMHERWPDDGE